MLLKIKSNYLLNIITNRLSKKFDYKILNIFNIIRNKEVLVKL